MNDLQSKKPGPRFCRVLWLAFAATQATLCAHASVSLLLEQPYGKLGLVEPSGHSAVYFDHICAETPTRLRACRPDELGVVLSRYDEVGGYDWLAVPLVPYLYGVERVDDIPSSVDHAEALRLRETYRRAHLLSVAPDGLDGAAPNNNWSELVGSTFDREIYGFRVKTTAEQDAKTIAYFNDSRNRQRYNGMFVNCADFVRTTIDRIYPHAIRRNFIADWGMSSPKGAARALAHYAKKHPETEYSTFLVPQLPGLARSRDARTGAEGLMKQYGIAVAFVSPWTAGAEFAAYLFSGRFEMPKDAPPLDVRAMEMALRPLGGPTEVVVAEAPVAEASEGGTLPPVSDRIHGAPSRSSTIRFIER